MREYFRGWRRKFGVVTLAMARVFAAGWVRSMSVKDDMNLFTKDCRLCSSCDQVSIALFRVNNAWKSKPVRVASGVGYFARSDVIPIRWRYEFVGIRVEERSGTLLGTRVIDVATNYSTMALTLALLSAYLLLRKPRPRNPPEPMNPTDEPEVIALLRPTCDSDYRADECNIEGRAMN